MLFNKKDKIGPYTVAFQHKQGAYAETYRVKDVAGKTRFLKLINYSKLGRWQLDDDGNVIEIEIAKQLNHPNLCRYVDSGKMMLGGSQYAYFVTEYVSGETLSQKIIRDGAPSVYEIRKVARCILSALSSLHNHPIPIIHNEVTMQNIMLSLVGGLDDLKLIDFGHARFLNQSPAKPDLNELNAFCLAPERFNGVCSVQSDLYSVGILIYWLLYGEYPWFIDLSQIDKKDRIDVLLDERDKELSLPKVNKFELDDQLLNTMLKALSYDTEDRFQTADEFIKAIDGELKIERQSTRKKILSNPSQKQADKPVVQKRKGKGFAAVAGMEELKQLLREDIIEPIHNPEEYRSYGVTIPNGMLLYGPPGCGKTFFAKHFAEEVGFNFMCITPATLKSRYINATQENIAAMFKEAEKKAPTIIFIDELNELVPCREGDDIHEATRGAVNEMLAQMDRTGEKGVFIIGATNLPQTIDSAIMRAGRLDKKYYVGAPDTNARKALFELYLKARPCDLGLNYDELALMTKNYVAADIKLAIDEASRKAVRQKSRITMELLRASVIATKPSLTADEIQKYEEIRAQIEGLKEPQSQRRRIGFK